MAVLFNVSGPTKIQVSDEAASPSFADLGFAADDDLPSIDYEYFNRILRASDTGEEPADAVYRGIQAVIGVTLVKWNTAKFDEILKPPGATAIGDAGIIGTRWVTGNHSISMKVLPITSGKTSYTFPRCILDAQSVRHFDFGNTEERLFIQFLAFRQGSSHQTLGDGSSATENLFTTATTS